MRFPFVAILLFLLSACASMSARTLETLERPGLEGVRWGLVVTTLDGRELITIRPDDRFLPASNTKLFTTAAAFHRLGDMTQSDPSMGASLRLVPHEDGPPDLVLIGGGDATLIDAPDCQRNCLSDLANAVRANGITEIGTVIADETLYAREPWPPGWNLDDIVTRSGAPVSAITVNSNEFGLVIRPSGIPGMLADFSWRAAPELYDVDNHVETIAADSTQESRVLAERIPGDTSVRIYGRIKANASPLNLPVAVHDPAWAAATRLKALLEESGIKVGYGLEARYRPLALFDAAATGFEPRLPGMEIARLVPPPLIEDVTLINKQSQNLHAELLLRRVGLVSGDGSRAAGLTSVEAMLGEAGIPRWTWDFTDGSGMSTYNRVTPRAVTALLRWTTQQTWGEAFRATLPVGGVDGTLRRRFAGTSLEGRIFAKTGTLTGTNALSGFMLTKSGQMLVFSAYANERPREAGSAIEALDATLVTISETN